GDVGVRKTWIVVFLLLGLHAALLWHSATQKSPTVDESSHLAAGLYSLTTGDFRLNREAAPLQNLICASLPALLYDYTLTFDHECWKKGIWNGSGDRLLEANPQIFFPMLLSARIGSILLSVLVCLVIFLWALELWGPVPAVLVLSFAILEPNLMAHGRLVTTDTSATLGILLTAYLFWRFSRKPGWLRLTAVGMAFGLAWYAKHSAFLFVFLLPIGFAIQACAQPGWFPLANRLSKKRPLWVFCHALGLTALCIVVGLLVIWVGYGFERGDSIEWNLPASMSPLWLYARTWVMPALYIAGLQDHLVLTGDELDPLHGFFRQWLPAYSHWVGFAKNQLHLEQGHISYFLGRFSTRGWLLYYPVLFLIKTPLPILLLFAWGSILLWRRRVWVDRLTQWSLAGFPLGFALVLMVFNTANIGYRHALPLIPFLLLFCGGAVCFHFSRLLRARRRQPVLTGKAIACGLILLALWSITTFDITRIHPHYLSYFNGLAGGWKGGRLIAIDSNLDWGQDLFFLKKFLKDNNVSSVKLAYFGPRAYPAHFGISCQDALQQSQLTPGEYVISVTTLQGLCSSPFSTLLPQFRQREPDAFIAPSLYYYHIP
ncbi:MAG: glycosyltransferase family 39 protein, partial [bacterium]|nr:glycosyltransferase family 39 protein [bacterium]